MPKGMNLYQTAFISESQDILETINQCLLSLEKEPHNTTVIDEIFRAAHSLKGMSAAMSFDGITALAHEMEDILDKVRKGEVEVSLDIVDTLFEYSDALGNLVREVTEERKKKTVKAQIPVVTRETQSVRISTERLNSLMDLAGELLIAKNRLKNIAQEHKISELDEALAPFDRLVTDLEEEVLKTRLVAVRQTFDRFPRMVRDIAREQGKEIELTMEGREIELDRAILDNLGEPLVHLLKNAIDHGIESPEERKKRGKPKTGKVRLLARREENKVVIEVEDDGRGMDPEEVKQVALQKGAVSFEEAARMSDDEALKLTFLPGFTTAKKATEVSGRGVGLDVVKTMVESLSGTIRMSSKQGEGTKVSLKLPLTTAIIQALLVELGEEVYAIPLADVVEVLKVGPEDIKTIQTKEVMVIRGKIIPLIRSHRLWGISEDGADTFPVVVARRGEGYTGLAVDSLLGNREIVVKPLDPLLKGMREFAGTTILGNGKVALILNTSGLSCA
jgi:two-component system chemotaxis sensor kinase CheA